MRALFVLLMSVIVLKAGSLTLTDTQALINQGSNYLIDGPEYADSAIACFSKVVASYHKGLPEEQMRHCAMAAVNLSSVYFSPIEDYKAAYQSLVRASEISDSINSPAIAVQIAMNFANIYAIFSQQIESPEFNDLSIEEYHKAFRIAFDNELWLQAIVTFCNFTSELQKPGYLRQFADEIREFAALPDIPDDPNFCYARGRQRSAMALLDGDTATAISCLKAQLGSGYETPYSTIYTYQDLRALSYLYYQTHRLDLALHYANELLRFGKEENDLEALSDAYRLMESVYRGNEDWDAAREMHARFLVIQDSILNFQNLRTVDNLKFINDLAIERRKAMILLSEADKQRKIRELIIFFAGLILVITVPLLIVIVNRHRRLKASYKDLYNRSQRILEQEEMNRQLREDNLKSGAAENETAELHPGAMRVLAVLDRSAEVFDPYFSLERLSELTDMRPRTLSATLNEQLHTTFRDLINQYRVREACKKLSDVENFGHYTIEAVAHSVGYKSRTSLVSAFRKETGLTPSEYQRIARQNNI